MHINIHVYLAVEDGFIKNDPLLVVLTYLLVDGVICRLEVSAACHPRES